MSSIKRKCQVIMLPTEKAIVGTIMKCLQLSPLHDYSIDKKVGQLTLNKNSMIYSKNDFWQPQHLYILSDEKIKESDYWFDGTQVRNDYSLHKIDGFDRKVIATTDSTLCEFKKQCKENCSGGNRSVFSEESKQKLRDRKHTDKAKEKIRLSKLNNTNKGYKWSNEKTESLRQAKSVKRTTNNNLPTGVCKHKTGFIARITILRKQYYLGFYNTPEEASLKYQESLLNYRQNNQLPK